MRKLLIPLLLITIFISTSCAVNKELKDNSTAVQSDQFIVSSRENLSEAIKVCGSPTSENYSCYRRVAVDKLDIGLCENAGILRNVCYSDIGAMTDNVAICEKIVSQPLDPRDGCYYVIGRKRLDASFCGRILNKFERDECYITISMKNKNKFLCLRVSGFFKKLSCFAETYRETI